MTDASETEEFVPDPYEIPLASIDVAQSQIFECGMEHLYFRRLRNEDPVHFNERESTGRFWSVTKFRDILEIDTNHELFSSAHGIALGPPIHSDLGEDDLDFKMFIAMDPPKHDEQRATVSSSVAPPNLKKLEPTIRQRAGRILDTLPVGETFDWVDTVSIELTTQMLATLFDFPFEDRRKLARWSDVATAGPGSGYVESAKQRKEELLECLDYFKELRQQRIGKQNFDLVTMLANGEATRHMEDMEYLGNVLLLVVGGNDTTRNSISGGVVALNEYPGEYEKLRASPRLIPNMTSEIIRYQTPLAYMRRTVNEDYVFRGRQFLEGDQVLMWYVSGNRDEEEIPDADRFLIDRKHARHHLAFGFGIHRCMGNRLAEMQLRVLWEEIMKRFHTIEVVGEPQRTHSSFVHGWRHVPVQVHPL